MSTLLFHLLHKDILTLETFKVGTDSAHAIGFCNRVYVTGFLVCRKWMPNE